MKQEDFTSVTPAWMRVAVWAIERLGSFIVLIALIYWGLTVLSARLDRQTDVLVSLADRSEETQITVQKIVQQLDEQQRINQQQQILLNRLADRFDRLEKQR